jgi:hypothetical protein
MNLTYHGWNSPATSATIFSYIIYLMEKMGKYSLEYQ